MRELRAFIALSVHFVPAPHCSPFFITYVSAAAALRPLRS
jgi:hypothetical protein